MKIDIKQQDKEHVTWKEGTVDEKTDEEELWNARVRWRVLVLGQPT
jgi:hypothetical protein